MYKTVGRVSTTTLHAGYCGCTYVEVVFGSIYPLLAFPWNLGSILMKKHRFQKLKYFTWKWAHRTQIIHGVTYCQPC